MRASLSPKIPEKSLEKRSPICVRFLKVDYRFALSSKICHVLGSFTGDSSTATGSNTTKAPTSLKALQRVLLAASAATSSPRAVKQLAHVKRR